MPEMTQFFAAVKELKDGQEAIWKKLEEFQQSILGAMNGQQPGMMQRLVVVEKDSNNHDEQIKRVEGRVGVVEIRQGELEHSRATDKSANQAVKEERTGMAKIMAWCAGNLLMPIICVVLTFLMTKFFK
jgi:hypothetical protein